MTIALVIGVLMRRANLNIKYESVNIFDKGKEMLLF